MCIVSINKGEARKVFALAEDLQSFRASEQYMDVLDEYVRMGAWSGETCNQFKKKLQEIQDSVNDARGRFDNLIMDFAEYTKKVHIHDGEGM